MTENALKSEAKPRVVKRDAAGRFLKGHSPKSPGRPVGARTSITESFLADLQTLWREQGPEILRRAATDDPVAVMRCIASLIPKEVVGRLEMGSGGEGIVINLLGVEHPLIHQEREIAPPKGTDAGDAEICEQDYS